MLRRRSLFVLFALLALPGAGQQVSWAPVVSTYKTVGGRSLKVHVFSPAGRQADRTAVVLFHGGGWVAGSPQWTYEPAREYAARGAVAVAVQYRLSNRSTVTPLEAVEDARDAIRWVRKNAAMLGIDPNRIVAHGVSAGGHLAAVAAESSDASASPNALVLWSPAVAVVSDPWFRSLVGNPARVRELSPDEHVRERMPPTVIISGAEDALTPESGARRFRARVLEAGGRCDLHSYEQLGHLLTRKLDPLAQQRGDFEEDPQATADAANKVWRFLQSLGYLDR